MAGVMALERSLLLALCTALPGLACGAETGFLARTLEVDGAAYDYQVYVPRNWSADREWPVILFLHGLGERGSDGAQQLLRGLPERIRETPDFPAVVVLPQCRRGAWWGDPEMETLAFGALDSAITEFHGDPARVYLTGLSMGGYGAWAFGYARPERFAAIVPVCGGVVSGGSFAVPEWHPLSRSPEDPYAETARAIGSVPVWAFHGAADPRVPVSESRKLTDALEASGGNVRYTEYPGVGHDSWNQAYWEEELIPWMLAQRNPRAARD